MPPCSLHQFGERLGGVEHLLVQAEPAREPGVGERRDLDRVRGHARIGSRPRASRPRALPGRARRGRRTRPRRVRSPSLSAAAVVASDCRRRRHRSIRVAAARSHDQYQHARDREQRSRFTVPPRQPLLLPGDRLSPDRNLMPRQIRPVRLPPRTLECKPSQCATRNAGRSSGQARRPRVDARVAPAGAGRSARGRSTPSKN